MSTELNQKEIESLFKDFLNTDYQVEIETSSVKVINVDFALLAKYNPELAEMLLDTPQYVLESIEKYLALECGSPKLIRIRNLPKSSKVPISELRTCHLGKLISVEGIVRQKSDVRPHLQSAKFSCPSCGEIIDVQERTEVFLEPKRCHCGKTKGFHLISKTFYDLQGIILEESLDQNIGDKAHRIKVILTDDLANPFSSKKTLLGNKIIVTGILTEKAITLKTGMKSTSFETFFEAIHVEILETTYEDIYDKISETDLKKINKTAIEKDYFKQMCAALLPNIKGYPELREAIILLLFGGVKRERDNDFPLRGDFHILLIGDPGTAKSMILSRVAIVAPKARFINAASSSGVGITAAVVKDEFLKQWALEAGALVLANKGLACVDELDKCTDDDRKYLHQAMEQQTISISKANIQETLQCQTTILAAANPKMGRFDPYQTPAAQIDLTPALISRFDLIFPIRDIPNKDSDTTTAQFILKKHAQQNREEQQMDLMNNPFLELEFFRKYIAYAKTNCFPTLGEAAQKVIVEYYVSLRGSNSSSEIKSVPITARTIEGLTRLAEASARSRLSPVVEESDARLAIKLSHYCLKNVGFDYETNSFDTDRIISGIKATTRNNYSIVLEILNKRDNEGIKVIELSDLQQESNLSGGAFEEAYEYLKKQGEIYEPRPGKVQLLR